MAIQVKFKELEGCKTYLSWLYERAGRNNEQGELFRILYETDFTWSIDDDQFRARDALELRHIYADQVGHEMSKSKKEIDMIWKSIHGKCSVLEILINLAGHLDAMVNEGEEGTMIPLFINIMMKNVGWTVMDDEDFDHYEDSVKSYWKTCTETFLDRKYAENGSGGGLFPLVGKAVEDQRKKPIWFQMNSWLEENLDDDGVFIGETGK